VKGGAKLWWGVAVATALLIGLGLGFWIGGQAEQEVFVELIARANLNDTCREQLESGMQAIIDSYEGKPAAPVE
jgi:hypothetical protein